MKKRGKNHLGFTLFEIIMTIVVGSIIIPPIVLMIIMALQSPVVMSSSVKGNSLASDIMEEILSKKWDESSTGVGPIVDALKTTPAGLGPESGETRPSFDDVDDYNGYSESPPRTRQGGVISGFSSYTRSVEVFYVQGGSSQDYDTPLGTVSNFKKIIVTVESPDSKNQFEAAVCNR